MNKSAITGIVLTSLSIGGLIYLYYGFYKPKQDALKEVMQETKK